MIDLQGPGSLKKMFGRTVNGIVKRIPDILFARKHLTNPKEEKNIRKTKYLFSFVSSPSVYKDERIKKRSLGWCHGFREPYKYLPNKVPQKLLPESDFMDPMFVKYIKPVEKKYDFFYYTLNSRSGVINKGLETFCDLVGILCGKMKLKGVVIVYFPNVPRYKNFRCLDFRNRQKLSKFNSRIDFIWGKLNQNQMAQIAAQSKFGFFPNVVDNSPRTISETLIRDVPVLINEKIHGGWHYVTEQTGELFNIKNISEKVELILKKTYLPRDFYNANYGFKKSCSRLALFVQSLVKLDDDYSHIYFNNYSNYLEKINV